MNRRISTSRGGAEILGFDGNLSSTERLKCTFCGAAEAAVVLEGLVRKPLCLLHYHTTRVIRTDPAKVRPVGDGSELRRQLPATQELFSEAFAELRKDIAEESARSIAAATSGSDPLGAMLHGAWGRKKPLKKKGGGGGRQMHGPARLGGGRDWETGESEGGFMREVELPERYLKQQLEQKKEIEKLYSSKGVPSDGARRKRLPAPVLKVQSNPYKRRKPTNTSIWNMAIDGAKSCKSEEKAEALIWERIENSLKPTVVCTCGSSEIQSDGNVTGRTGDIAKGETWGNKDRSELVTRYRCERCGKSWNEEE